MMRTPAPAPSLRSLLLLATLAAYGFWISLAGRPLINADMIEKR